MKNLIKKTVKVSLAAGTALAGVTGLLYEGVFNARFSSALTSKLGLKDKKMMEVLLHHPVYTESYEWFDALDLPEVSASSGDGRMFANVLHQDEKSHKWAVLVHGFTGEPRGEAPFALHFYENGYNLLFPHLRGHCSDPHKHTSMGYFEKDMVISWINYIINEDPDAEIVLHGTSMGASSVLLATGEDLPENVKCAIEDAGFSSCRDEFSHEAKEALHVTPYPFLYCLNVLTKAKDKFDINDIDVEEAVKKSKTPTLFIHGTGDNLVPYVMMEKLYLACSAPKDKFAVKDAPHVSSVAYDKDGYFKKVDEFIAGV